MADFNANCDGYSCTFSNTSTDDGAARYDGTFGDGTTSTDESPVHLYGLADTYTVTLKVTDSGGESTLVQTVPVEAPAAPTTFTLQARGYKEQGRHTVDLRWTGANGGVEIFRDGVSIDTGTDSGSYTDSTNNRGGGSYTYEVCDVATETEPVCSNEVSVTF